MRRAVLLLICFLAACSPAPSPAPPTPTFTPKATPPIIASPITISNAGGTPVAEQPGFVEWVLLSGVDEHGIIVEHFLNLLADADPGADPVHLIHTGHPVVVHEIRHVGPQNLQRFYRVETLEGFDGWISDYYVRRTAYVFNINGTAVPIFDRPGGAQIAEMSNVTPVTLLEPQDIAWWRISSLDGSILGWVFASMVKESPENEFLIGSDHEHECQQCPFFLP